MEILEGSLSEMVSRHEGLSCGMPFITISVIQACMAKTVITVSGAAQFLCSAIYHIAHV